MIITFISTHEYIKVKEDCQQEKIVIIICFCDDSYERIVSDKIKSFYRVIHSKSFEGNIFLIIGGNCSFGSRHVRRPAGRHIKFRRRLTEPRTQDVGNVIDGHEGIRIDLVDDFFYFRYFR